jgi:hypothetical protein
MPTSRPSYPLVAALREGFLVELDRHRAGDCKQLLRSALVSRGFPYELNGGRARYDVTVKPRSESIPGDRQAGATFGYGTQR